MAKEAVVKLKVEGGDQAVQPVKNIKKELKEANRDLISIREQFGALSPQALEAAKRVAGLRDEINDAREVADLFDPGKKLGVVAGVAQSAAAGFTAVQGAMGLFGAKSKEVEEQLLKVQSAMALSQGLSGVLDSAKNFQRLGAIVKTQVVTAFNTLRGAIIATGIGALAVGLGLVIANFEKVKEVVLNLIPGLGKVADMVGKFVQKVTDFVGITSEAKRQADALNKSLSNQNDEAERRIKVLQAQGGKEEEIYKLQKDINANRIAMLEAEKKANKGLSDEKQKELQDLYNNGEVLDAAEQKRKDGIRKQELDKEKAKNKEIAAERKRHQEELEQQEREAAKRLFDETQSVEDRIFALQNKRITDKRTLLERDYQKEVERINATVKDEHNRDRLLSELRRTFHFEMDALNAEQAESEKAAEEKKTHELQDAMNKRAAIAKASADKMLQDQIRANKEKEAADKAMYDARVMMMVSFGQALSSVGDLIGRETAAGKALAIAQATINTWLGATEVLKQKSVLPEPAATISKIANVGAIVASGLVSVRNITRTQVPGGGGGATPSIGNISGSIPMSAVPVQASPQAVNQALINAQGNAVIRAYISQSDNISSQEQLLRIQRAARLG